MWQVFKIDNIASASIKMNILTLKTLLTLGMSTTFESPSQILNCPTPPQNIEIVPSLATPQGRETPTYVSKLKFKMSLASE